MIKHVRRPIVLGLLALVLSLLNAVCYSAGLVTFEIEIISGFTVSSPESLVFDPVAPGQTSDKNLIVKVWSNVEWDLLVAIVEESGATNLSGSIEYCKNGGVWQKLTHMGSPIVTNQSPTGEEGREVILPFRFTGSYDDVLGTHSLQVELTVAPAI